MGPAGGEQTSGAVVGQARHGGRGVVLSSADKATCTEKYQSQPVVYIQCDAYEMDWFKCEKVIVFSCNKFREVEKM